MDGPDHLHLLREARERAGLSHSAVAAAVGIPEAHYFDLETFKSELSMTLALEQLKRLFEVLGLEPTAVFGIRSTVRSSFEALADAVRTTVSKRGISVPEFEEQAGWEVAPMLRDPASFAKCNLEQLKAICEATGINWIDVLSGFITPGRSGEGA